MPTKKKKPTKSSATTTRIDNLDAQQYIVIKGARMHNLKNVDVAIPRRKLVVVTGVSGSGKSSLTIDTLYAEGQRRYVESLSSYARQFLNRMDKPDVDYIKGISPAIAIEQKVITRSSRSTVGTLTEVYDYLRLLFARLGKTYSPISGQEVKKDTVTEVVNWAMALPEGSRIQIFIPFKLHQATNIEQELELLLQKGFSRVQLTTDNTPKLYRIEALLDNDNSEVVIPSNLDAIKVLIDRVVIKADDEELRTRLADSVQTAFNESYGDCIIEGLGDNAAYHHFSNRFELDGISFTQPSPQFFNFNNAFGACKTCDGFGKVLGIDEDLVIPNKNLSVFEGAIAPWQSEKMSAYRKRLVRQAPKFDFPIHRPIKALTSEEYKLLWEGNAHFDGINDFFKMVEENGYKIQYRVMLSRYRGRTICPDCKGTRLRKDAHYVKFHGYNMADLVLMPIKKVQQVFAKLKLSAYEQTVAKRIMTEINNRLSILMNIGLGYLTLNRFSSSLSGGETQRINLTRSIGSNLTNSMYILDEPSIGLHPRDTERMVRVLKSLRDLGNTVLVVEHEEAIIRVADFLIDMGPHAGRLGGELVFAGSPEQMIEQPPKQSLTADYLLGKKSVAVPKIRRKPTDFITISGATQHNLKDVHVRFPLKAITVVTGVSGSGKTTLVKDILYPAIRRKLMGMGDAPGKYGSLGGAVKQIKQLELIDQNPLGKSSRSNPATFIKAYDSIRDLYARQQAAKINNLSPGHFSFNVEGGRCENCKGDGEVTIEMQFLADVHLTCEVCQGKRFKREVLEVTFNGKNIYQVLEMSVDEAIDFFKSGNETSIAQKIQPLQDVGWGYIKLGQSSSTLSGGEAQRVKLASYLGKGINQDAMLFLFDEPSTGLHFHDINKLLAAFNALVENGHSVIIIEHNIDIIKAADWIIDLGPEGGEEGGYLLYEGAPEGLVNVENSYTARFLAEKL